MLSEIALKRKPTPKIPSQAENILEQIKRYIDSENFRFSEHAIERGAERSISPRDALYILENGYHDEEKTKFVKKFKTWNYAIRGRTIDKEDILVVVALAEEMVIITVIRTW